MQYKCPYPHCEQVFNRRTALKSHVKTHNRDRIDEILNRIDEQQEAMNIDERSVQQEAMNDPVEFINEEEEEEFVNPDKGLTNIIVEEDVMNIGVNIGDEEEEEQEEEEQEGEEKEGEEEELIDDDVQVRFLYLK